MRRLRDDRLLRRGPLALKAERIGILVPALMFVSVCLMLLSRIDHAYIGVMRAQIAELLMPVLSASQSVIEPGRSALRRIAHAWRASEEVDRLTEENRRLKGDARRVQELELQVAELSALGKLIEPSRVDFLTSRVIADSSGAFLRSVMINTGRENALRVGYPVVNGDGLVGRVVALARRSGQVLLLTDVASRIPVQIGPDRRRAVVVGDNGSTLRIEYLPTSQPARAGDEVTTSGTGGLFPRGLRIGVVVETPEGLRVRPHADLDRLEYVSVVFHVSPALELTDPAPARTVAAPTSGAPPRAAGTGAPLAPARAN